MNEQTEWRNIKAWAKSELVKLRNMNETDLDTKETAMIRGQIKAIRRLLDLEKEPEQKIDIPETGYID